MRYLGLSKSDSQMSVLPDCQLEVSTDIASILYGTKYLYLGNLFSVIKSSERGGWVEQNKSSPNYNLKNGNPGEERINDNYSGSADDSAQHLQEDHHYIKFSIRLKFS